MIRAGQVVDTFDMAAEQHLDGPQGHRHHADVSGAGISSRRGMRSLVGKVAPL